MTLVLAFKYSDGTILAADTRTMLGDIKRDKGPPKLITIGDNIGVGMAGLVGACDDVLCQVKKSLSSSAAPTFENVIENFSDAALDYYFKNAEKADLDGDESNFPIFIVASPDRIRTISSKGYTEEDYDYECIGSYQYGEYILGNRYRANLNEEEAKELAIHTILETSKIDPNVSDIVELLVLQKGKSPKRLTRIEIDDLKLRVIPVTSTLIEEQNNLASKIVELRGRINELFQLNFGFKLFQLDENAVFQIMKPCRSETEFTSNIAALGLLIDRLEIKELEKAIGKKDASINLLEEFLKQKVGKFPPVLITNLRDIMTMRRKKFPIHTTDPKFNDVVIRVLKYWPPKWHELYSAALNLYIDSLQKLLDSLPRGRKK